MSTRSGTRAADASAGRLPPFRDADRPSPAFVPFAGYAPKYKAVENAIKAKYPQTDCVGEATPNTSGAFEVVVDGNQVHSKLNGDGHVDSPEKLEKILAAIGAAK